MLLTRGRRRRKFPRIARTVAPRPTPEQLIAQAVNAIGQCAYDKLPCYREPRYWVAWQDGRKRGEAAYCGTHTTVLVMARSVTYITERFPVRES